MSGAAAARATRGWSPEGFDDYRAPFPRTPPGVAAADRRCTDAFIETWSAGLEAAVARALVRRAARTTVVFVRGFLGNYMPGNLVAAARAVRRLGFDAVIARTDSGAVVEANASALVRQLGADRTRERLLFCAHSRGGVECLTMLAERPELARRSDGVAAAQMPFGPSAVLASMYLGRGRDSLRGAARRGAERAQRAGLALLGARAGGRELGGDEWRRRVERLAAERWPFPVVQTATWSVRPTAWLDSFHQRLGEIAPGRAHDGQFYLDQQLWPAFRHVLLPRVDHAQPCMGGHGFDVGRYWVAMLATLVAHDAGGR